MWSTTLSACTCSSEVDGGWFGEDPLRDMAFRFHPWDGLYSVSVHIGRFNIVLTSINFSILVINMYSYL